MLLRTTLTILGKVLLAALVIVTTHKSHAQIFDFENNHPQTMSLDGQWRFHLGDDPVGKLGWANPDFDDSQWILLRSSLTWSEQGYKDYGGFAWYRVKVTMPPRSEHLGILIPQLRTSYEIFADGKLVGRLGGLPPQGRYVIGFYRISPFLRQPTDRNCPSRLEDGLARSFGRRPDGSADHRRNGCLESCEGSE